MTYQRILRGTNIINTRENHFFSKVLLPDENGCMIWIGGKKGSGYGLIHNSKDALTASIPAHRFSYQLFCGSIPEKLFVCHTCDNRLCVAPDHLFLGTYLDNIKDMNNKKRHALGERNGHSKLTEKQVRIIKKQLILGMTPTEIAKILNLSHPTIHNIKTGTTWKHIEV